MISGLVLGILVSLSSVGAGAIGVTVLILLYPRVPLVKIVGSDIAHAVPLTLLAGAGHWMLGDINWSLLGSLLIGSIPGILAGSYIAPKLPEYQLAAGAWGRCCCWWAPIWCISGYFKASNSFLKKRTKILLRPGRDYPA